MKRANKHNSHRHEAVVGGQHCKFDSMAEHRYAEWLERQRKAKRIRSWEHHPKPLPLHAETKIGTIAPDFLVRKAAGWDEHHEVKGMATALWRWKRRHLESEYPFNPYVVIDAGRGVCATGNGEPELFDDRPKRKRRKK